MKQLFKKPSYYLISSAMDGNEKAIEKLLAFYDPYISKCCLRSLYDESSVIQAFRPVIALSEWRGSLPILSKRWLLSAGRRLFVA